MICFRFGSNGNLLSRVSLVVERQFQFRLLAVFYRSFNTKPSPSPYSVAVVEENDVPID
jgi:hypothetical protein